MTLYVIVRGWQDFDGPEADIFSTREAAEEQLRRLGGESDNTSGVQEQLIYDEPFADDEEDA